MQLVWLFLSTLVPSFFISLIAVALVRRYAPAWKLVDKPTARKNHGNPVPLGGGLGIWAGLIGCFLAGTVVVSLPVTSGDGWLPESLAMHREGMLREASTIWWLLAGGTVLMLLGLSDDRGGVAWQLRLLVEVLVAAAVVIGLGLRLTIFISTPWLTTLLSILWIVALVNSFNMLDNMDGLSGGVAFIVAAMSAIMLLLNPEPGQTEPQLFVAATMLVLCGALAGFLFHNRPPARIFMGDAGSYLVGYWIAVVSLMTTYTGFRSEHRHAVLAPLCILAIPLYDMVSVILIRLREGRSPFQADRRHFSHRLVELGMTKVQAVLTIYFATITCGLAALLLNRTDGLGAILIGMLVASILGLIAVLENVTGGRDGG
jgi:UDP-GlcNAc:undecaprenyl-phosphate GlcNAc-1-phosphate transferase